MDGDLVAAVMDVLDAEIDGLTPSDMFKLSARVVDLIAGWPGSRAASPGAAPVNEEGFWATLQAGKAAMAPATAVSEAPVAPGREGLPLERVLEELKRVSSAPAAAVAPEVEVPVAPEVVSEVVEASGDDELEWGAIADDGSVPDEQTEFVQFVWPCDGPRERKGGFNIADHEVAALLRADPGVWFEPVPRGEVTTRALFQRVQSGGKAFRPRGAFEARMLNEVLQVRFFGEGPGSWPEPVAPEFQGRVKFDLGAEYPDGRTAALLEALRSAPGVWLELVGGARTAAANVGQYLRQGWYQEIREDEKFDALKRNGRSFARLVV